MSIHHSDHLQDPPVVPVKFVLEDPEGLTGSNVPEREIIAPE